jgi:DNA-binding response OmpR family regulator
VRVLIVEDEPHLAEAIRDGARRIVGSAADRQRKRLGEPGTIATVLGVGYRIETAPGARE